MSLFLLVLGIATAAAGVALVASGAAIHDGAFDAELITPGTIATVGGLLLIAMGLAVRQLQRIERALVARPVPRAGRPVEVSAAGALSAEQPARMPSPPKPKTSANPQPASVGAKATRMSSADDAAVEHGQAKSPATTRIENGPVIGKADGATTAPVPPHVEEEVAAVREVTAASHGGNGAVPAHPVPRVEAKPRLVGAPAKAKASGFRSFWLGGSRQGVRIGSAQLAAAAPQAPTSAAPIAAADLDDTAAVGPVSVLKSGVVEGLSYTLYSDGSIEAQLPQGRLRFGSIAALRSHIESAS
jgi:hypothetical protein